MMLRDRLRDDRGLSLLEVLLAAAISAVVFGVFAGVLVSVQRAVNGEETRVQGNDQTRLALENLDRHVRSASMIFTIDEHNLVVATRSNTPTVAGANERCMQWVVTDDELRWRWWPTGDPAAASGWAIVAKGVVNRQLSPTVTSFELEPSQLVANGAMSVNVSILVNTDLTDDPDATVGLETSIAGRNVLRRTGAPPASPPPPCDTLPI